MKFLLVFLARGIFRLLSLWVIIPLKKLIRWETAGNGLGQGLCRSWRERREGVAGEGDTCQVGGGGSLWRGREGSLGRLGI